MPKGISLHIGLNKVDPKAYPPGSVPALVAAETDARCMRNVATYYYQKTDDLIGKKATS
ncbi:MAG: caspase family protein, partial [Candidatus Sericytochromatia bacterium]|nr:caspase family protein [Candidatus Sericytochromatia bacterium]